MSDRLEYLRNCTPEEREDEGTDGEYEELEAAATAVTSALNLTNDAEDYKDVNVYVNVGGKADWLFTVSLDKSNGSIFDSTPRFSASTAEPFEESDNAVPDEVTAEFQRVRPQAVAILQAGGA